MNALQFLSNAIPALLLIFVLLPLGAYDLGRQAVKRTIKRNMRDEIHFNRVLSTYSDPDLKAWKYTQNFKYAVQIKSAKGEWLTVEKFKKFTEASEYADMVEDSRVVPEWMA